MNKIKDVFNVADSDKDKKELLRYSQRGCEIDCSFGAACGTTDDPLITSLASTTSIS